MRTEYPTPERKATSVSAFTTRRSRRADVHGEAVDYAKMMFWSFVAGFSERFVTDIVSKFENDSGPSGRPGA